MKTPALFAGSLRVVLTAALLTAQILPAGDLRATNAVDLLIQKARSLEARDREDLAAQVWHQVLVTSPNQPEALAALARWAKRSGRSEEANAYLAKLRRIAPDDSALTQVDSQSSDRKASSRLTEASKLAADGRSEEAMRIYREVFGSNPPAGGWSIAYYQTLANTTGGFEPAVAALKRLAESYPDVLDYKIAAGSLMTFRPSSRESGVKLLASVEGSTAAVGKARQAWRQALLWEKANSAYIPSFQNYLTRYKDAELQSALEKMPVQAARAGMPNPTSHEEQLGYEALKKGQIPEAEHQFDLALQKESGSWRAHAGRGFALMKASDFDSAVQEFETAHKVAPEDVAVRNALGTAKFWQAMHRGALAADKQDWNAAVDSFHLALSFRANDHEALRGLGGALLAVGDPVKAVPYLTKAVEIQKSDQSSWQALAQAKLETEGGRAALAVMHEVPSTLTRSLEQSIGWKALQSSAYADAGNEAQAIKIYRELTAVDHTDIKPAEQVELANLALRFHDAPKAVSYAERAMEASPNQTDAWETLLSALVASGRTKDAERLYAQMPHTAQEAAMTHSGFKSTLAALKESSGDLEGARMLLEEVTSAAASRPDRENGTGAKIQLAQVLAKLGRAEEAETMMSALTDTNPDDVNVWRAHLFVLQTLRRPNEIELLTGRMPQAVAVRLGREGDMVNLLASAHAATGNKELGVKLLEAYISRSDAPMGSNDSAQRIQLAWLLLDFPSRSGRLYGLLDQLNNRTDLSATQQKAVASLWSTWISRTADTAHKSGNDQRALALLESGARMFPNNTDLQRAMAGTLLAAGNTKRALNIYSNWGLAGAQPDDFAGAISAALAERNFSYADAWIDRGLSQWPGNAKLLTLAGERAQSRGDLKNAERLWKEALAQKKASVSDQAAVTADPTEPSLKMLLAGSNVATSLTGRGSDLASGADGETLKVNLSSFQEGSSANQQLASNYAMPSGPAALSAAPGSSYLPKSMLVTPAAPDSLEDKIAGIESRNTPYLSSRMSVWERGGQSGFDRLVIQQEEFEASTTLANELRASLLLIPTYLSSGSANGSGQALFGTQSTPAGFGSQNASGLGAEAQLSSQSFGLRLGTTPQGFLMHNWLGGFRLQPKHGPITLLLERDSMKDSMLSYAGARDPQSNQVWGGVMADTASLQGKWGDDKSGFYLSGAYQAVDGHNVARNTGVNGGAGTWWKVASLPTGNLTVGMSFFAMHYERNLRYYTFGQGGYFSPQEYVLFSIPVRWTGTYANRLKYTIGGSLGSQHFTEDASDYYPTNPVLQAATGLRYQAFANTGANFNFDGRLSYQMAPHWILGAFANANNARNYTAAAAGLFVKYTFEERPMNIETVIPSIPDWKGQQPFSF